MTEQILRFYIYTKKSIRGPFTARDAAAQPNFNRSTLVCPEKALGQWHEAALEPAFQTLIETPPAAPAKPRPPMSVQGVEEAASRSLLEKAISKNANLERDVKDLRKSYNAEKAAFEETLRKKDMELKALADKLKRSIENSQNIRGEHPSWETLYKTLKKRSEDKLSEAAQAMGEKNAEINRLKEKMLAAAENSDASRRKAEEAAAARIRDLEAELEETRSQLEEKEMVARTFSDNIATLAAKNEEFQKIMFDERRDAEEQNAKFCEEIGRLKADIKWRDGELAKIREELFDAMNRIREAEATEALKSREQEELYGVLSAKLRLLSGYFENLESKVKYAFRKA
jgi:chromosome segregation ATPase